MAVQTGWGEMHLSGTVLLRITLRYVCFPVLEDQEDRGERVVTPVYVRVNLLVPEPECLLVLGEQTDTFVFLFVLFYSFQRFTPSGVTFFCLSWSGRITSQHPGQARPEQVSHVDVE